MGNYTECDYDSRTVFNSEIKDFLKSVNDLGGSIMIFTTPIMESRIKYMLIPSSAGFRHPELAKVYFDTVPVRNIGEAEVRVIQHKNTYRTRNFLIIGDFASGDLDSLGKRLKVDFFRFTCNDSKSEDYYGE